MQKIIHWFRRDLRLHDNPALRAASETAKEVIPVYIVTNWRRRHAWTGPNRQEFLCSCLEDLAAQIKKLGGQLVIRSGNPIAELDRLRRESHAEAIYYNRLYDPFAVEMERALEQACIAWGIASRGFTANLLIEPGSLLTKNDEPFRVYSAFARAWRKAAKPAPVRAVKALRAATKVDSEPLPTLAHWDLQSEAEVLPGGEPAAQKRQRVFLNGPILSYGDRRDFPGDSATSRLSQDLRFGLLSPRELYARCVEVAEQCSAKEREHVNKYIDELIWREFYSHLLWHYPDVLDRDFSPQFMHLSWDWNPGAFRRWREGTTGFPIVDAGMRQLSATGFMHNRVRMIVAMFLTKDLHIHWRGGESYFMRKLVDGDIAANNGGWQWSAGTGADAAPYFRIQNPWTQTVRYDPAGRYIKRWVPELADVNPADFMRPSPNPLAKGYPLPMVDHDREREVTLERFHQAKHSGQKAQRDD